MWSERRRNAITEAGFAAGDYLEALGKTDLAELTEIEFRVLIETIITTYYGDLTPWGGTLDVTDLTYQQNIE